MEQALAQPEGAAADLNRLAVSLLVTAEVRKAVGERFATAQLESLDLKGVGEPVEVFRLSPRRRG